MFIPASFRQARTVFAKIKQLSLRTPLEGVEMIATIACGGFKRRVGLFKNVVVLRISVHGVILRVC